MSIEEFALKMLEIVNYSFLVFSILHHLVCVPFLAQEKFDQDYILRRGQAIWPLANLMLLCQELTKYLVVSKYFKFGTFQVTTESLQKVDKS